MTISSSDSRVSYNGNGSTQSFSVPFFFLENDHLQVILVSSDGTETVQSVYDYTVSGAGDEAGGEVTMDTAPETGESLIIMRNVPFTQETDYPENDIFPAQAHELALDKLTMMAQQLKERSDRSLAIPPSSNASTDLPVPEASSFLAWSRDASRLVNVTIPEIASLQEGIKSVADWEASGNGIDSAQTEICDAVAFCYVSGDWLYWPPGTYLTTASIPYFHSVRHFGPGVVKRGSTLFYVDPAWDKTNTLHVATTGAVGADGLSSSTPMRHIQEAFDALHNAGPHLRGTWQISLAAGTYNEFGELTGVSSSYRIKIFGPAASGGVPTAIVDGTGLTSSSLYGIWLQNGIYATIKDIKVANWNGGSGVGPGDASIGVNILHDCNVWLDNVDGDLCGTAHMATKSRLYVGGGRVTNCDAGTIGIGSSNVTFGYGSPTTYTGIPVAVTVRDASSGVVEGGTFTDNGVGIATIHGSAVRVSDCTFSGSTTADVYSYTGSSVYFGSGNTHTAGKKFRGQFALDLANADQFYYDADLNKFNFGELSTPAGKFHFRNTLTGASLSSSTQFIFEDDSPQIGLMGKTSSSIFGFNFSIPAVASLASLQYVGSDNTWRMKINQTDAYRWGATSFIPMADNTCSLGGGASAYRWTTIYATTGTINTSDARDKQDLASITETEKRVALAIKASIKKFRFKDAVAAKGDDARIHFGVVAQEVAMAFQNEGLDPFKYGLVCFDEWGEEAEEKDSDGNVVKPYKTEGNRYGIRYEELMSFLISSL